MQAAGDLHNQIGNAFFGQAQDIFDNPTAFDAADRMFNHHPRTRENSVEELLAHAQLFALGLFFGCVVSVPSGS